MLWRSYMMFRAGAFAVQLLLLVASVPWSTAYHPALTRKGILLWQVQLSPDQCGSPRWTPCFNVYAVNETHGDLVWFAFTTSSAAVKGMFLGHHSVYYTTWAGPGLYAVNAANGHVRWQFPLDNWFRYWVKDIDLDRAASFDMSDEVLDRVYVSAPGPPARLYGLSTKSGARRWEFKLMQPAAELAGVTGPVEDMRGRASAVILGVTQHSSNSSWLQALQLGAGSMNWQSPVLNSTLFSSVQLHNKEGIVLVTTAAADAIHAFDAFSGALLWSWEGTYCRTPSPTAELYDRRVLLSRSCEDLSHLTAIDVVSGQEDWHGWSAPSAARPAGNCSAFSHADGSIFFGCSCHIKAKLQASPSGTDAAAAGDCHRTSSRSSSNKLMDQPVSSPSTASPGSAVSSKGGAHVIDGVCLYALKGRDGHVRWVLPLPGNASFPAGSQQWGLAPVLHGTTVLFFATDRVIAADVSSGKLRWLLQLQSGEQLQPWARPVVDDNGEVLVVSAAVSGSSKTGLTGVSLRDGRLLWHKTLNGTGQHGAEPADGQQQLLLSGGRVFVEACRGSRCCLRALNASTGKQRWGMCLDALQGDDATHPHAQFAIWFITLVTIVSIALLVLGAGLVYIQRWGEEQRILHGGAGPSSPRHTYQPLPPRPSDSDEG